MKLKKFIALLSMTAMIGCLAVGCGSSDSDADASAEGEDQVEEEAADWDPSSDITIVSREDGSGTRGAFIELFGIEEKDESGEKIDMTTEEAQITNSTSVMMTTVVGDDYAIGYISLGSLKASHKRL